METKLKEMTSDELLQLAIMALDEIMLRKQTDKT